MNIKTFHVLKIAVVMKIDVVIYLYTENVLDHW